MATCTVRWRPSGGRGEYEFVPSTSLADREVIVRIDALGVDIPAAVFGVMAQGKPRLRKQDSNNRSKMHLVPLVMAVARLPEPAREDKAAAVSWPLEDKGFIVSGMDFDIASDDGHTVVLRPLGARILHAEDKVIDLRSRFAAIAKDFEPKRLAHLHGVNPPLAAALERHRDAIIAAENDIELRQAASEAMARQVETFGKSNLAAVSTVEDLPPTPLEEDISGVEGRVLTRLHSYRERDKKLVKKAKAAFKAKHKRLYCECCGIEPAKWYGPRGEDRIHAHHRTPVEELLPDTETKAEDLAMVCPTCHDIIHAKRPWISVEELHEFLVKAGNHHFGKAPAAL